MDEKAHKLAKYGIYATIIAAIIGAAATLFIYFDSKDIKTETVKKGSEEKNSSSASVLIKKIQLTPVAFDIPSSFYLEIESGPYAKAKNISVIVDFGEAEIKTCSFRPNDKSNITNNGDKFVLKLNLKELAKNESFYIHCHISAPAFKKILISGGNISISSELTFASFKDQEKDGKISGWAIFFSILAGLLIIYLFLVFIRFLNRLFKMQW